ncbi:hypothetical protein [Shimia sp.]
MKTIAAGFAAMIVIAFAAWFVLGEMGFSSAEQATGQNVRLD